MTEELPAAAPDPSWFYSSLAQSTAAIVGFVGAFLIFRIQDYTASWTRKRAELETLQRRWIPAQIIAEQQERVWDEAMEAQPETPRASIVDPRLESQRDATWRDLRPLLDDQIQAAFPTELVVITSLLGLLFVVGTLLPLLFLAAPANSDQAIWAAVVGLLLALTAVYMLRRSHSVYLRFKQATVLPIVANEYEMQQLNEEAWEQQAQEYKERQRLRAKESDRISEWRGSEG